MSTGARIPLTTIAGFLGAGKTTLVNRLLASTKKQRIVVFVNDFGAVNIDYALIETVEENRISLKNGCICCTLNDDLLKSVVGFTQSQTPPDGFLIEASGVADSGALRTSLQLLEQAAHTRTDAAIYLVDCDQFPQLDYEDSEAVIEQAAQADYLLFSKSDLVDEQALTDLAAQFAVSAPHSKQIMGAGTQFDAQLLLFGEAGDPHSPPRADATPSLSHQHAERFISVLVSCDEDLDQQKFEQWARQISTLCLRAKGFVRLACEPRQLFLFNLVGLRFSLERMADPSSSQSGSEIVLIGHRDKMQARVLRSGFCDLSAEQTQGLESPCAGSA